MREHDRKRIETIKRDYPIGMRVWMVSSLDQFAPPPGTGGTVDHVDDIGTVHVNWDNGSRLGVIVGEDLISGDPNIKLDEMHDPFGE